MKKSLQIAIGLQAIIMVLVIIPPLFVKATGTDIYLQTEQVDPRSLLRGHYVTLRYPIVDNVQLSSSFDSQIGVSKNNVVYITITTDRPASFVRATLERPELQSGEACITGQWSDGWDEDTIEIPQLSQFFAPKEVAVMLQNLVGDELVAKAKTTKNCNAVLVGVESL